MSFISKLLIQHFPSIDFSEEMVVCKNIYLPDKGLNRKLHGVEHFVRCLCKHSLAVQPVTCRAHCTERGVGSHESLESQPACTFQETWLYVNRADSGIHKTARQNRCVYSFNFFPFTLKFGWVNLGKTNSFLSV